MLTCSVVGNADLWRVVFVDAEGEPTNPDGDVTWTIYRPGRPMEKRVQSVDDRTGVGTFETEVVPDAPPYYNVKVECEVGGRKQATPLTRKEVVA